MPDRFEPFVHGPPFEARYTGGECAVGGDDIDAGERIVMFEEGAAHVDCVDHSECPEHSSCA